MSAVCVNKFTLTDFEQIQILGSLLKFICFYFT